MSITSYPASYTLDGIVKDEKKSYTFMESFIIKSFSQIAYKFTTALGAIRNNGNRKEFESTVNLKSENFYYHNSSAIKELPNKPSESKFDKILSIEDNSYLQNVIKLFLSKNFEVITLNNAMEAMSFLQNGGLPDVIVTDLDTPLLGGYEFLVQLKSSAIFKSIPLIVLTAEESSDVKLKCFEAGADDYVQKPFNPKELHARINVALKRNKNSMIAA